MTRRFDDISAFTRFVATDLVTRVNDGLRRQAQKMGKATVEEAKSAIGTYRYGWPALKPETIARKRRGDTPLLETGQLRDSIGYKVQKDGGVTKVTVGSNDPKARTHEFGNSRVPPRPFLAPAITKVTDRMANDTGRVVVESMLGRGGADAD